MYPGGKAQEVILGEEVKFVKREGAKALEELDLLRNFGFVVENGVGSFSSVQFFLC
jgi:hypothetical protein